MQNNADRYSLSNFTTLLHPCFPVMPLLSSWLASDMQRRAARSNKIASFSFCSHCPKTLAWKSHSTLLGYQILRAPALLSSPVVPQTGLTSCCFSTFSLDIRWASAARKSLNVSLELYRSLWKHTPVQGTHSWLVLMCGGKTTIFSWQDEK